MRPITRLFAALLGVMLAFVAPVMAQDARQVDETGALVARQGPGLVQAPPVVEEASELDYAAWERLAARAENATASRATTSEALEALRRQVVDWRSALLGEQNANAARIATLRAQIAALGPNPAEGAVEAEEIAKRRSTLTEQLVTLQAPGLAAEEAYRRADGLIAEIDRVLRDRQADQLLQLWPAPINPANWPEAVIGLTDTGIRLVEETGEQWQDDKARDAFGDNLPFILLLLALAGGLIVYGRAWIEGQARRLQDRASARGRRIWALLASLGEVLAPAIGITLGMVALGLTQMLGETGTRVVDAIPDIAMPVFLAAWLGGRVFPRGQAAGPLELTADRRAEARWNATAMGLLLGLEQLRFAAMDAQAYSEGTTAVVAFPGVVLAGLLLLRMGQFLFRHSKATPHGSDAASYGLRLIGFLGQGAMVLAVLAPLLAAVGYVPAAQAIIYPALNSLFLIGLLLVLQDLVTDLYAVVARADGDPGEALFPVLANFALALVSLPVFALIWGARTSDLTEVWTRFREGFALGDTRISPTNFMIFAVVFGIGYVVTRMFQGGLKSSILPRTKMDQGGQNAIHSGVGYIGIFLAALAAINAAGIDLSGLAIVAGALSVGIGFGLQTVVSNFVSGIILLIERPVSEGDWIEVGTTQGIVKSISVRSTRIQTFDRSDVIVPNSDLIAGRVTNWTRFNLTGRIIVPVGVDFSSDTRKVERVLREIAEAQPLAILNPAPIVALVGFGADAINFEIRLILRDVNFSLTVRSEINHMIVKRFAEEGIEIPFAHTDVSLRNVEAIGQALTALQPAPFRTKKPPANPEPDTQHHDD